MHFDLPADAGAWMDAARAAAAASLQVEEMPDAVFRGAAAHGLPDRGAFLLVALAVESMATVSVPAALAWGLHMAVHAADRSGPAMLMPDARCGMALATEGLPRWHDGRLTGRVAWGAPLVPGWQLVVGALDGDHRVACAVPLDGTGVTIEPVATEGLDGFLCGHIDVRGVSAIRLGPPEPFMTMARLVLAAVGLGIGGRALAEALESVRGTRGRGAGGEQTVQGLLADAATALEAARMLVWKSASGERPSLGDASMAKLASTEAAQGAVANAAQVLGAASLARGHVLTRLASEVRALEVFGGRTETLREAIALEQWAQGPTA